MIPSSEVSALELRDVCCSRAGLDGQSHDAVHGVSAVFAPGTFTVLTSSAASERILLLRLLSLLETPDRGDLLLDGLSTHALDPAARAELRARRLGLVFSAPFLLPAFSAIENIAMPLFKLAHIEPDDARKRAEAALAFVGLSGYEEARGEELTRAQQQGVSLARALAAGPAVLLIEEIDSWHAEGASLQFAALLRQASEQFALIAIATTSPPTIPSTAHRIIRLERGAIEHDSAPLRQLLS